MNETFNYLRANGIYSLEDLESRVSEHSAATESLKKTLDEQTARMKAIKQLYDSSAAFQSLKPVYDGLQKIKFEKPRAKYKAEHEAKLKQFYAARRKLTGEFPDGKVDMKKLTEEYDELEQAHETTYGEFKTVRDDLHRLWKVKSCVDTATRFNERAEEQKLQNRPQTCLLYTSVQEDEWTIFENTHEPIIDQQTFDLVQKIRGNVRRYPDGGGEAAPLTGLLYCADCGGKMYVHRTNNGKRISQKSHDRNNSIT